MMKVKRTGWKKWRQEDWKTWFSIRRLRLYGGAQTMTRSDEVEKGKDEVKLSHWKIKNASEVKGEGDNEHEDKDADRHAADQSSHEENKRHKKKISKSSVSFRNEQDFESDIIKEWWLKGKTENVEITYISHFPVLGARRWNDVRWKKKNVNLVPSSNSTLTQIQIDNWENLKLLLLVLLAFVSLLKEIMRTRKVYRITI